ncbi:hypothetical protein ACFVIM_14445 [Streptomyces sp. NPDC057638]|uniref:hypothetical protein n=1 Tax=Streptomyces sp. NPDC057638 TaxID=3346190 RepID=UPI0036C6B7CF
MSTGCGCGCGGASTRPPAFVRPRFFAGQLLTEDDLGLLVDYLAGKNRLYNRSLHGPGVIRGLEVACDPCGGGTVTVRPGHALDCAGNDIVVPCPERVDVAALVRDQRVAALGTDCGEPCEKNGPRRYGLVIRYEERAVDPVAPYATEEPCATPGCVPSRLQESFRFLIREGDLGDHGHNPGSTLLGIIGDPAKADQVRSRDRRLGLLLDPLHTTVLAPGRPFRFDAADAQRYATSLAWLRDNATGTGTPPGPVARAMTEHVRALAAAIARYDTYDPAGQTQLARDYPDLATLPEARQLLGTACTRLAGTDTDSVWPQLLHRALARAVVTETPARLLDGQGDREAPLELRLLAQGTPVSHALRVELRADLNLIRDWLLARLERTTGVTECALRSDITTIDVPPPLPAPPADSTETATLAELRHLAEAAAGLTTALRRFITTAACSALSPPATDCDDTDVLLAQVEFEDCDVVRVCFATREQVLPGGSSYGEWLPKLYPLRELAQRLCCAPVPPYQKPVIPEKDPVPRPYTAGLLDDWPRTGDLEKMLSLLLTPAPGETPPKALHEQVYTTPSEVSDSILELAALRTRVADLSHALEGLRAQLGDARDAVSQVRGELPERLGSRLEELEEASTEPAGPAEPADPPPAPPVKRTRSSRPPKSGEGS